MKNEIRTVILNADPKYSGFIKLFVIIILIILFYKFAKSVLK